MVHSNNLCRIFLVVIICFTTYFLNAQNGQNILVNGDFESNPPTNFGNNVGHSVAPWILGSGNSANVVRVDGPTGQDYGSDGPQSDASGVTNGFRHYLDIAGGSNSFYQSFTPSCSGSVTVGGYFSTRANAGGRASIKIRRGNGLNGAIVGQSVPVILPGGNSEEDAWTLVSHQVNIQANETYSFIVDMNNQMNFDEGFATYDTYCPPPEPIDPCCPPIYKNEFLSMFNISGDFQTHSISFTPNMQWRKKMQAYTNWRHALDPCIESLSFNVTIRKPVAGTTDNFDLAQNTVVGGIWIAFKANDANATCYTGNGSTSNNGTHTFNGTFPSNRWHRIHPGIWFNPTTCDSWDQDLCSPHEKGFRYNLQVISKIDGKKKFNGKLSNVAKIN